MFAFAVWDERRGRLVLGRDRVGKKPLYYWHGDGRLVFGSEIKAVLADPGVPRELEPGAIPAYLTFGYVPTPRTFFDGVRSLPPGHVLTFEPGGEPVIERYWEPPLVVGQRRSAGSSARSTTRRARCAALLRDAVEPAADLGRAARRLPERRNRLERDRRDHGLAHGPAGRDVHDRLRRPRRLRRAAVRQRRGEAARTRTTTSSWSTRMPSTWSRSSSGTTTSRSATRAPSPPTCSARSPPST